MLIAVDLVNFQWCGAVIPQTNPELECLLMTRVWFGLTGLNQLGPKCRGCVFVQLASLNSRFGLFVCFTEWWSHKWRVRRWWQVRKHPKHTHTHMHPPTGASLEEAETVELCQEERSWASCASVRRLQEIGCVCVCVCEWTVPGAGIPPDCRWPTARAPDGVGSWPRPPDGPAAPLDADLRHKTHRNMLCWKSFQLILHMKMTFYWSTPLVLIHQNLSFIALSLCFFTLRQYRSQI